jgi:hypothetical protein
MEVSSVLGEFFGESGKMKLSVIEVDLYEKQVDAFGLLCELMF